jgi:uncharacterized protein (UPF0332 family)
LNDEFDPEIFLEISKQLRTLKILDLEGRLRTAIGRSYYAAFLKTLKKLQSLGESFRDNSRIHYDIRNALNKRKKGNISSKLNSLFELRVTSDYKLNAKIDNSSYQKSITLSENIINLIESI